MTTSNGKQLTLEQHGNWGSDPPYSQKSIYNFTDTSVSVIPRLQIQPTIDQVALYYLLQKKIHI